MNILKVLLPAAGLLLSACAATGPSYSDVQSKIPVVAADKGRVYFYRNGEFVGKGVQPDIKLNGETVGESKPGGFFYVDRDPGQYEVSTSTETTNKIVFKLDKGQERYIRTSVSMGVFVGHVRPELVYPDQGISDLSQCKYTGADADELAARASNSTGSGPTPGSPALAR